MRLYATFAVIAFTLLNCTAGYNCVFAAQTSLFDSNIHIDVTHPSAVRQDSKFTISTVLKAKNPDIVNITMILKPPTAFNVIKEDLIFVPALKPDSTLGYTFELESKQNVTEGAYSFNFEVNYEKKEILGDYSKQMFSKAFLIELRNRPEIVYFIKAPDSLFAGDKFSINVELRNIGFDAKDVTVSVIAPDSLTLVGQNTHKISKLESGGKFDFEFALQVHDEIKEAGDKLLQIKTSYLDAEGNIHESTETFPLFVRPRGFLEIGSAGGFWIGPVFVSFITGIGSIASAAVGFLILIYRIKQRKIKPPKRG
ncbi:MAG: hypothetical protein QXU32_07975 [Nitrososphaerales archaeon]